MTIFQSRSNLTKKFHCNITTGEKIMQQKNLHIVATSSVIAKDCGIVQVPIIECKNINSMPYIGGRKEQTLGKSANGYEPKALRNYTQMVV